MARRSCIIWRYVGEHQSVRKINGLTLSYRYGEVNLRVFWDARSLHFHLTWQNFVYHVRRNRDTPCDGFSLCLLFLVILLQKVLSKRRIYRKGQAFHIEVVVRLNALTHEKPSLSSRYQIYEWECDVRTTPSCLSSRHRINAITQSFRDTIEFAHNAFYTFRSHSRDSSSFRIIGGNDRDVETWKKERAT